MESSNMEPMPPAGWYDDPDGSGGQRYFDGNEWQERAPRAAPPAPGVPVVVAAQTKTSGYAIASLVLGLVWGYGVGSILAIIFAVIAKNKIKEGGGTVTGGGMATAGLVLGIIGVVGAAIIILAVAASEDTSTGYYTTALLGL
jgi:hypothetical protein